MFIAAFEDRYTKKPGEPLLPFWCPETVRTMSGEASPARVALVLLPAAEIMTSFRLLLSSRDGTTALGGAQHPKNIRVDRVPPGVIVNAAEHLSFL